MGLPSLLVVNARLVGEDGIAEGDLLVAGGRIAAIGGDLRSRPADAVLDAAGRHLLPGLIDSHVHFREPGGGDRGSIAGESAAAVAGGVTSCCDMPNTDPPTTTAARLAAKRDLAASTSRVNLGCFLGATDGNLDELLAVDPATTPGVKVYLAASTGGLALRDGAVFAELMRRSRLPVAVHAEDEGIVGDNAAGIREVRGRHPPPSVHAVVRSREACMAATARAVELARSTGADLHVCHVSTADELVWFAPGPVAEKRVTAEACLPHLCLAESDYGVLGNRMKCNPAVKEQSDRRALRAALRDGRIDTVATDHAPHPLADKERPYFAAAAGIPGVQYLLPFLLDLVDEGELALTDLVRLACHNPARRFGIVDRGFLREGYWADLALVDTASETVVEATGVLSPCGWSPYEGRRFAGRVDATVVSGGLAFRDGRLVDGARPRLLQFRHGGRG